MRVTERFVCSVFFLWFLRTGVMSRQITFDSGTRELLFGKAADTTDAIFVCPGNANYPVPGQECTNAYYSCVSGNPVLSYCPGASVFEPTTHMCTSSSSAPCKKNSSSSPSWTPTGPLTTEEPMTTVPTTESYDQSTTKSTLFSTPKSTTANNNTESTLITQKSTTTTTTVASTESTPFVCPGTQANGNYANPNNCKTFYMCSNGNAYLYDCPSNLVFNPTTGNCDYEENVSRPCGSAL